MHLSGILKPPHFKAFPIYAKRAEKTRFFFNQRWLTGLNTKYSMIGSGVTNSFLNTTVTNEFALNDLLLHTPSVNHLSHQQDEERAISSGGGWYRWRE